MFFLFREMRHLNGGPEKKLLATPTQRNVYAVRSDKYDSDRAIWRAAYDEWRHFRLVDFYFRRGDFFFRSSGVTQYSKRRHLIDLPTRMHRGSHFSLEGVKGEFLSFSLSARDLTLTLRRCTSVSKLMSLRQQIQTLKSVSPPSPCPFGSEPNLDSFHRFCTAQLRADWHTILPDQ